MSHNDFDGYLSISASDRPSVFVASPSAFLCNYPSLPPSVIMKVDRCRQDFKLMGIYTGLAVALLTVGAAVLFGFRIHQKESFAKLFSIGLWLVGAGGFVLNVITLSKFVGAVENASTDCSFINQRALFLDFLPMSDCSHAEGSRCVQWLGLTKSGYTNIAPLANQSFETFVAIMGNSVQSNQQAVVQDISAFQTLCASFPRCAISSSSPLVCTQRYDETKWANKPDYAFVVCTLACLTVMVALELSRWCTLAFTPTSFFSLSPSQRLETGATFCRKYAVEFTQTSLAMPLLAFKMAPAFFWNRMLWRDVIHSEFLFRLVVQSMLVQVPVLILQLWFWFVVKNTGTSAVQTLSAVITCVSTLKIVAQGIRSFCRAPAVVDSGLPVARGAAIVQFELVDKSDSIDIVDNGYVTMDTDIGPSLKNSLRSGEY